MILLYLVRHGETVDNIESRIQGQADSPLTELGRRQNEAIAKRLESQPFTAIYSSDTGRALATAEAIAAYHDVPVLATDLLRELHFGEVEGLTRTEFEERYPVEYGLWRKDSAKHRPPGSEPLQSVVDRCGRFLELVRANHKDGESIAVVLHGGSLRALICAACDLPLKLYATARTWNASLSILELDERSALRLLNDTCHLDSLRGLEFEADNPAG